MFNFKFYPKFIREIITNIPTLCFETIEWNDFLVSSTTIVKNYLKGQPSEPILDHLKTILMPSIQIDPALKGNLTDFNTGHSVLKIYFLQLKNPHGMFLDLRANHFHQLSDGTTLWKPNALYHKLDNDFRLNLLSLYTAYYNKQDKDFEQALVKLGMCKGLNADQINELKALYYKHFGESQNLQFKLEVFQESFLKIFEFFIAHKIKLQTDFIYIGFYLITLYMHLEKYEHAYNVEKVFFETFESH